MITDKYLRLSEGQEVLTSAVSTNTIDLSQARDVGEGKPLYMVFTVTTAFTRAAGALTVAFNTLIDDDAALGSPTTLASTGAIAKADLAVGAQFVLQIPPVLGSKGLRYLGASFTNSATADTGKVTVDIVETFQDGKKFYPSGYTV